MKQNLRNEIQIEFLHLKEEAEIKERSGRVALQKMSVGLASRYRGSLVGCAVGDALGTTLEFLTGPFEKVHKDMTGGGRYSLLPGQWTDGMCFLLS